MTRILCHLCYLEHRLVQLVYNAAMYRWECPVHGPQISDEDLVAMR